jgi:UDP-N-acetylglucosamine 2-epimerase (non-hydrolysing)
VSNNGAPSRPYGVLTLHRPSNVEDRTTLNGILTAVKNISHELPVFFPVHPRTRKNLEAFGLLHYLSDSPREQNGIIPLDPLGYLEFLSLNDHARLVMTDSGGVQEETTVLGVPCLTLRENTERPATVEHGTNQVVGVNPDRILAVAQTILRNGARPSRRPPLWDGKTAPRIVEIIRDHLSRSSPQN